MKYNYIIINLNFLYLVRNHLNIRTIKALIFQLYIIIISGLYKL